MTKQSRARTACGHAAVALFLLAGLVACAGAEQPSYRDQIDQLCADVNKRFGTDLAYGDSFGVDDLDRLEKRMAVLNRLSERVDKLDKPDGANRPTKWLAQVDSFVDEDMRTLLDDVRNATMGSDLALAMRMNIHDSGARTVGEVAAADGLRSCAKTNSWRVFPK